jgi:hypothetical protein
MHVKVNVPAVFRMMPSGGIGIEALSRRKLPVLPVVILSPQRYQTPFYSTILPSHAPAGTQYALG